MPIVLGIDTGGTFTDGVILDTATKTIVAKSKAFTTPADLSAGIRECISGMKGLNPQDIALVSLSTTLATNAIVEGRGCRVGLLLIGHGPAGPYPAQQVFVVEGGHTVKGAPQKDLDTGGLGRAVAAMAGKVDTVAISGYLSVRNPEHELLARSIVEETLGVPVVCAHQLTGALGFQERTVTACLNARLLPIIAELLQAVKEVLKEKGIRAPLMVVKGNGSLMGEEIARERPIETILSGPGASITGATFLTGTEDAMVLDMGGTTTDLALLDQGRPKLNQDGATVGGWKTRVEAAEISTFGIGGDSYIRILPDLRTAIGPKRVWPLSVAASRYPYLARELAADTGRDLQVNQATDCWTIIKPPSHRDSWTEKEWQIIRALAEGPHHIFTLAERVGQEPDLLPLSRLEEARVIGRVSLTPTDILHALGIFKQWNVDAALAGATILARRLGRQLKDFLQATFAEIIKEITLALLQTLAHSEGLDLNLKSDPGARFFLDRSLSEKTPGPLKVQLQLKNPIVAIGAPVPAYLPEVGKILHTGVIIPPHAEVANAVGAAAGPVLEVIRVIIRPNSWEGFLVHAPWGREAFPSLEKARDYAIEKAKETALEKARRAGAINPVVTAKTKDLFSYARTVNSEVFTETQIEVTARGYPYEEI